MTTPSRYDFRGDGRYLKTEDGNVDIEGGLRVFTYDWKWGVVDGDDLNRTMLENSLKANKGWELTSNDWWFYVRYADGSNGLFNYQRVTTKCPNCRRNFDGCNDSGCGGRKEPGHLNDQKERS